MIIVDRIDLAIKDLRDRYIQGLEVDYTLYLNKADYDELSELGRVAKITFQNHTNTYNTYVPDEFPWIVVLLLTTKDEEELSWLESSYTFIIQNKTQRESVVI